jgi:hypothetical protein
MSHRRALTNATAAVAVATAVSGCGGHNASSRRPTRVERAAIQQAIFDYVAAQTGARNPSITQIRVSPISTGSPGNARYAAFARADLSDQSAGYAAALLGYHRALLSGWRVLDLGSAEVGCDLGPAVYGTRKHAVLLALALGCP